MADTRRTLSALQTILADNTSGDISPQDIRDMLVSVTPPYGGVSLEGNATATTISTVSTPVVADWDSGGTQTAVRNFTVTSGGRITYSGTPDTHAHVVINLSLFVTINASKEINVYIYKNGTTQIGSHLALTTQGNGEKESTAIHCDTMMSTNDYLELWVSNETDSNDITIEDCYVFAMGMLV